MNRNIALLALRLSLLLVIASVTLGAIRDPVKKAAIPFDHGYRNWHSLLQNIVGEQGVRYGYLVKHPRQLKTILYALRQVTESEYANWDRNRRLAYWINTYNVMVLDIIVRRLPEAPRDNPHFPTLSVRQIKGFWDDYTIEAAGRTINLSDIEHQILYNQLNDYRTHFALCCGTRGSPPLSPEAYVADRLTLQLDTAVHRFCGNPIYNRIEITNATVSLSPLFQWYESDFATLLSPGILRKGRSAGETAALMLLEASVAEKERRFLLSNEFKIRYLPYDWSLNWQ